MVVSPPDTALMLPSGGMTLTHLHGGKKRPGEDLDLHNVVFIHGGSQAWFEEPNVLWVWHCTPRDGRANEPTKYEGTWSPCTCACGHIVQERGEG